MTSLARLYILNLGLFHIHGKRTIGIPGYVLRTQAGKWLLIDTGFRQAYSVDVTRASQEDGLGSFGVLIDHRPENGLDGQLAQIGISIADIDVLLLSHTHIDHVGWLPAFAGKRIVMHPAERNLTHPVYFAGRSPFGYPDASYTLIDTDSEFMTGLCVHNTPGHTIGHLSFELTLPNTGRVLLACDAISRMTEFVEGFATPAEQNQAERVRAIARASGAWMIYGHDPLQWQTLRKAPQFYD